MTKVRIIAAEQVKQAQISFGFLDVDQTSKQLRVGMTSTNPEELSIQVAERVVETSSNGGEDTYSDLVGKKLNLSEAMDVLAFHGFQLAIIPGYVAQLIKDEESAVVNSDSKYFFDGSYLGIFRAYFDKQGNVIKGEEVA